MPRFFLPPAKICLNENRNNIIKSVRTGCYPETPHRKDNSEINTRDCPENKLCQIKYIRLLAAEKCYMMMRTEKSSRNQNRQHNRLIVAELQQVAKENHQNTYQYQPEHKLLINARTNTGYDTR